MTQLWAWEYEGKTEVGWKHWERTSVSLYVAQDSSVSPIRDISQVTNLRKVKVVDETEPKTYLTTDQFIKVFKSLSDEKSREVGKAWSAANPAAWSAAWDAAWDAAYSKAWYASKSAAWSAALDADLAILAKDKITAEQFEILTSPWTSCGLSLFAEDWSDLINPVVISEGISND